MPNGHVKRDQYLHLVDRGSKAVLIRIYVLWKKRVQDLKLGRASSSVSPATPLAYDSRLCQEKHQKGHVWIWQSEPP